MTADIRTAAQREAESKYTMVGEAAAAIAFVEGAVWAQARVTPTREQIERALIGRDFIAGADAILALMQGLAEGGEQ